MITLLAAAYGDGLAFVNVDGIFMSFSESTGIFTSVSDGHVGRAICDHGFEPVSEDAEFETAEKLIEFMQQIRVSRAKADGFTEFGIKDTRRAIAILVECADSTTLNLMLDRLERETAYGFLDRELLLNTLAQIRNHATLVGDGFVICDRVDSLLERIGT